MAEPSGRGVQGVTRSPNKETANPRGYDAKQRINVCPQKLGDNLPPGTTTVIGLGVATFISCFRNSRLHPVSASSTSTAKKKTRSERGFHGGTGGI